MCSTWPPAATSSRPAPSQQTGGVTLLKNRVTGVVDLGGVAPLPADEGTRRGMAAGCGGSGMSTAAAALQRKQKAEALVEMCSVRLGKTLFGVPITHILEIVGAARPQPVPLAPGYVGGLVHYRGDVLTTVSLRQLLALAAQGRAAGHSGARERRTAALGCWWIRWARC